VWAGPPYCNLQYKWHFSYENYTFQGQFLHYLVISNRKLEIVMGIYIAVRTQASNPHRDFITTDISEGLSLSVCVAGDYG